MFYQLAALKKIARLCDHGGWYCWLFSCSEVWLQHCWRRFLSLWLLWDALCVLRGRDIGTRVVVEFLMVLKLMIRSQRWTSSWCEVFGWFFPFRRKTNQIHDSNSVYSLVVRTLFFLVACFQWWGDFTLCCSILLNLYLFFSRLVQKVDLVYWMFDGKRQVVKHMIIARIRVSIFSYWSDVDFSVKNGWRTECCQKSLLTGLCNVKILL